MDVNVTISVFNAEGHTANDVMTNRVKAGRCGSKYAMEAAVGYVWRAKYPCSYRLLMGMGGYDDAIVEAEDEIALDMIQDGLFFDNFNGYGPDLDDLSPVEYLDATTSYTDVELHDDPEMRRRHLQSLRLRLAANPRLVEGRDVECDAAVTEGASVPVGFSCQEFVATLKVRSFEKGVLGMAIREDVIAAYQEAEADGNLTLALDRVNVKRTFQAQKDMVAVEKASSSSSYSCGGGAFVWFLVAVVAIPVVFGLVFLGRRCCAAAAVGSKAAKEETTDATLEKTNSNDSGEEQSVKTAEDDEWDNESDDKA